MGDEVAGAHDGLRQLRQAVQKSADLFIMGAQAQGRGQAEGGILRKVLFPQSVQKAVVAVLIGLGREAPAAACAARYPEKPWAGAVH